jgi:hypothetical protein
MTLLPRLLGLLLLATLSQLTSCALLDQATAWHPPLVIAADSSAGAATTVIYSKNFYAGSYKDRSDHRAQGGGTFVTKANAPVASGTSQAQDFTKAGQHGGALATSPNASAGATTHTGLPPWLLGAGSVVLLLILLLALAWRFRNKLANALKISV